MRIFFRLSRFGSAAAQWGGEKERAAGRGGQMQKT